MVSPMLRRPRVMLVGPWKATIGGVTTFMSNVAMSPLARDYEIVRFNTARPAKRNVSDNYGYGAIFRGGVARFLTGALVTLLHMIAFPFTLLVQRPAIAQIQSSDFQTFWESAWYVLVCRALRISVVMRLGGAFDNFYSVSSSRAQSLIRRVLQWPDRLIVQSEYWRSMAARLGRTQGLVVLPNCIADDARAHFEKHENDIPICLFAAGSEATRKGVEEVLAAMRSLKAAGISVRFHIVAATAPLRAAIEREGLSELSEVEGYIPHEHMLDAMRAADIFLLPSRAEGFPNALLEAMASGAAAIVTPVGSVPEIVDGDCAAIVPVNDSHALTGAITRLANDKLFRDHLARAGRDRVLSRYTQNAVLPILDEAWRSMLGRRRTRLDLSPAPPP